MGTEIADTRRIKGNSMGQIEKKKIEESGSVEDDYRIPRNWTGESVKK